MPSPKPVAFTVFGIDIMWYGLLVSVAIVSAVFISYRRTELHRISQDHFIDMVLFSVPAGIIGARLYYVVFNFEYYGFEILKIINIRSGGLAIHGGLIFGFATAALLCRKYREHPLNLLDLVVPGVSLAQSIGRWGNYFNSEAHGRPTDLPWGVVIDDVAYHPTFLYESLWCFALFIFLIYKDNRRIFFGQIFSLYLILYSLERFFVESLRTDSLMLGPLKQAQVISVILFISGALLYIYGHKRKKAEYERQIQIIKENSK